MEASQSAISKTTLGLPSYADKSFALSRFARLAVGVGLWSAILFTSAGRLQWTRGWIYVALYVICVLATEILVSVRAPNILAERVRRHSGTRAFDKVLLPLIGATFFLLSAVAGLDRRFGHSHVTSSCLIVGIPMYLMGAAFVAWSMVVNPLLEVTVRIQHDRGQRVISSGPYAFARHPMYAGIIVQSVAAPLMLGTMWAYVPVVMTIVLFVTRTVLEDRVLREELVGYAAYTRSVRSRLIPWLW